MKLTNSVAKSNRFFGSTNSFLSKGNISIGQCYSALTNLTMLDIGYTSPCLACKGS